MLQSLTTVAYSFPGLPLTPRRGVLYHCLIASSPIACTQEEYGALVLTDSVNPSLHVNFDDFYGHLPDAGLQLRGMQLSAADLHLFSLADYHVITSTSGFGKVGALIGHKSRDSDSRIYAVDRERARDCEAARPDSMAQLAQLWSGL